MPIITSGSPHVPEEELDFQDAAENEGGPTYQIAGDESRVERPILLVDYGDISKAVRCFIGYPSLQGATGDAAFISRVLPDGYPDILDVDNQPYCWATAVVKGDGLAVLDQSPTGAPFGKRARLRILYSTVSYEVLHDSLCEFVPEDGQDDPLAGYPDEACMLRYITRNPDYYTRIVTVPRALMRMVYQEGDRNVRLSTSTVSVAATVGVDRGPAVMEGIGKNEGGQRLEYVWHFVPEQAVPHTAIANAIGRVNSFTFDRGKYPPGTVRLDAARPVFGRTQTGLRVRHVRYTFTYAPKFDLAGNERGHNYFLRVVSRHDAETVLDYRLITSNGLDSGTAAFGTYDFAKLFRPEPGSAL